MRRRELITLLGGAAPWPLAARAEQPAMPVVGFMSARSSEDSARVASAFRQGLATAGFIEGQTVKIEYRWANGNYDKLPVLAADLVNRKVAVLVGIGGDVSAVAAAKATKTIPVVFGMGNDPVKAGLVASFNRPGGNATGFTVLTSEMESKRLGLLRELVPAVQLIGILVNPKFPASVQQMSDLDLAAKAVSQRLLRSTGEQRRGIGCSPDLTRTTARRRGSCHCRSLLRHTSRANCQLRGAKSIARYLSVSRLRSSRRADQLRPRYCRKLSRSRSLCRSHSQR